MKLDNSISLAKIKKTLTAKAVMIVLLVVTILSTVLFVTLENLDRQEILIWCVTTDPDYTIPDHRLAAVYDYGEKIGIDKIIMTKRHPEDSYFDVIMSTTAYYSCDIFIMKADVATKYSEMDIFLPLSYDGEQDDDMLFIGGVAVGIKLDDDYYLLVNAKTEIDHEIIYNITNLLRK